MDVLGRVCEDSVGSSSRAALRLGGLAQCIHDNLLSSERPHKQIQLLWVEQGVSQASSELNFRAETPL